MDNAKKMFNLLHVMSCSHVNDWLFLVIIFHPSPTHLRWEGGGGGVGGNIAQ